MRSTIHVATLAIAAADIDLAMFRVGGATLALTSMRPLKCAAIAAAA